MEPSNRGGLGGAAFRVHDSYHTFRVPGDVSYTAVVFYGVLCQPCMECHEHRPRISVNTVVLVPDDDSEDREHVPVDCLEDDLYCHLESMIEGNFILNMYKPINAEGVMDYRSDVLSGGEVGPI